jgi:hypothetical protein
MTYNVGPFNTTCFYFPHPKFVLKNYNEKHPTIFAGIMTSTDRQVSDHQYMATQIKAFGATTLWDRRRIGS